MTTMTTTKLTDIIARAEREGWTRLYLGNTRIGDAGAKALAAATGLGGLEWLDLGGNEIGDEGEAALRERWGGIVRL